MAFLHLSIAHSFLSNTVRGPVFLYFFGEAQYLVILVSEFLVLQNIVMPNPRYTDFCSEELWELARNKDSRAFKHLFEKEFPKMLAFGLVVSKNKYDVKDAIQDVFFDLWEKKDVRSDIRSISKYLLQAVRFRLIKSHTKNNIIPIDSVKEELKQPPVQASSSLNQYVNHILKSLPKNHQEILHLKYQEGLTNAQIAEVLGVRYQSVSNNIHRIIKRFRIKFLEKNSGT